MVKIATLVEKAMGNKQDERPTEYSFVFQCLTPLLAVPKKLRKEIWILDIGCAESHLSKVLADLGFTVFGIDINDWKTGKASFIKADFLKYDFKGMRFDVTIAISTIEHIGLPAYGYNKFVPDGDLKAMVKMYNLTKKGGIAIVTVPYGTPHHPPYFERVYNPATLERLLTIRPWEVIRLEYAMYCDELGKWRKADPDEALFHDAVAMALLRKEG